MPYSSAHPAGIASRRAGLGETARTISVPSWVRRRMRPAPLHKGRGWHCRCCMRWCITTRCRCNRWKARPGLGCNYWSCRGPHWWRCQGRIHRASNSMGSSAHCRMGSSCSRSHRNPRSCNTRPHRNSSWCHTRSHRSSSWCNRSSSHNIQLRQRSHHPVYCRFDAFQILQ